MKVFEIQGSFGIENLRLTEHADREPGRGEVKIRLEAVSLNYRDVDLARGTYGYVPTLPFVPVSDGAGVVEAVGDDVTRVRVGDRVMGHFLQKRISGPVTAASRHDNLGVPGPGLLAESVILSQESVVSVPQYLTPEEAATLPIAGVTAWNALFVEGNLQPGQTVLTQGTGGVSLFAVQFARLAGARAIVTSSSDSKLDRARKLGADGLINYRETPDWDERVKELTGGEGVDQVIEIGGDTLTRSLRSVRYGGHIHVIGYLAGRTTEIKMIDVILSNSHIHGISVGSRDDFEAMNRAIAQSGLRPVIDRVFAFEEAQEAFRYVESGAHFGKVVIRIA